MSATCALNDILFLSVLYFNISTIKLLYYTQHPAIQCISAPRTESLSLLIVVVLHSLSIISKTYRNFKRFTRSFTLLFVSIGPALCLNVINHCYTLCIAYMRCTPPMLFNSQKKSCVSDVLRSPYRCVPHFSNSGFPVI